MNKTKYLIIGVSVLFFALVPSVFAATTSIVSDTSVQIIGVYNKYASPTDMVDLSSSPLPAVLAAEPVDYPTFYQVDALNSVWDRGTGYYFQNASPVAKWIWETVNAEDAANYDPSSPLYDPNASSNGRVVVFQKSFDIAGIPKTGSYLHVAADNCYEVWINGHQLPRPATAVVEGWEATNLYEGSCLSSGWQTVGEYLIDPSFLNSGENVMVIKAGNEYYSPDNPNFEYNNSPVPPFIAGVSQRNPGALIFKLDVVYDPVSPLFVTKTANTSYNRAWKWTIDKTVDHPTLTLAPGQDYTVNYNVRVNATSQDSDWAVSGTITISNPNPIGAEISGVSDSITGVGSIGIDCGAVTFPYALAAGGTLECSYSSNLPDGTGRTNTATVTATGDVPGNTGAAEITFGSPAKETDKCVDVTDTNITVALGSACADSSLPSNFPYPKLIGPYDVSGTHTVDNTATFITRDTSTTGSDNQTVTINVPAIGCTLTQGYWKNHADPSSKRFDSAWDKIIGGADETFYNSAKTYLQVLQTPPKGGNAYYQLAHQFIAAELNRLDGASLTADVKNVLDEAGKWFGVSSHIPDYALTMPKSERNTLLDLAGTLGAFNEGKIGPGHCDEQSVLVGKWLLSVNDGAYLHDMFVLTVDSNGVISGIGGYPGGAYPGGGAYLPGFDWTLTGQLTGNNISLTLSYQNGYAATITGTVSPTWDSMGGGAGTGGVANWSATRK